MSPAAMRPTPYQTYLDERLQSGRGLGWDSDNTRSAWAGLASWIRFAWPQLLRFAR